MTHDESPFQSPKALQIQASSRLSWLREQPLIRLLIVAIMSHVAAYTYLIMLLAFVY